MTQDPNPQEALASIQAARESVSGDLNYPFGYDLLYGAICGVLVAGQGVPQPWSLIMLISGLAAIGGAIHWWRRRFGWWISGYSPRRARWVAFGLAGVLIGLILVTFIGREQGVWWISLATGPAAAVLAIAGGRLWMHVWKGELRDQRS